MGIIGGIVLIVLGLLCLPALVAEKSPSAKELLDKITPAQGWIGLGAVLWGVFGTINAFLTLDQLTNYPILWTTNFVGSLFIILLGFLFGYGLIQEFALKKASDEAKAKAEEGKAKLVAKQKVLGVLSVLLGLWVLIYHLFIHYILL